MTNSKKNQQRPPNWKWAMSSLKVQKHLLTALTLSTLTMYATSFIYPLALQQTIDSALNKDINTFFWMLSLSIFISIIEIMCSNSRLKLIISLGTRLELKLLGKFLRSILSRKYNQERLLPGNILNSINQIKCIKDFLLHTVPQAALDLGQAAISLILIAYFSKLIAILLAVTLLISALIIKAHSSNLSKQTETYFKLESQKQNVASNITFSLKSIKCHAIESFLYRRFIHQSKQTLGSLSNVLNSSRSIQLWGVTTSRALTIGVLICGCFAVSNGRLTFGELITIQILIARMISPLSGISDLLKRYQEAKTAIIQIDILNNLPSEPTLRNTELKISIGHKIAIRNISSIHPDGTRALQNISVRFPDTGLVVLAGTNGSGKSTLVHTLLGIHDCSSGEILFSNEVIASLKTRDLRKKISFMEQDSYIFSGSLRENLCCGKGISDSKIYYTLEIVDLTKFVKGLPNALDHIITDDGKNLSGGQKQKICLARALLRGNSFYILDEPTSAMDGESSTKILKQILELSNDCLVICVTHDPIIMRDAETILLMSGGSVIASGNHDELIRSCAAYKAMYFSTQ